MSVGFSSVNVANKWLDVIRTGGTSYTAPATVYVKLHTADPGSAGATGAAAGSTTRVAVTHTAPAAGAMAMNGTAPAWTNGGTSETISHISVWDASVGGNFLYSTALTVSKAWASGDTLTLNTLALTVTPIAA